MTLCDASPLIALINKGDDNHQRCVNILPSLLAPLITTCACFTEAMYLLGQYGGWLAQQELWGYVADEILVIHHHTSEELTRMETLMAQYRDVPMDLADASLVAMAEVLNQRRLCIATEQFWSVRKIKVLNPL